MSNPTNKDTIDEILADYKRYIRADHQTTTHIGLNELEAREQIQKLLAEKSDKDYIALVCPVKNCRVAMVSPRDLSIVHGVMCDPVEASSVFQLCDEHYEEGDIPEYFDIKGNQVDDDPYKQTNTQNKEE